MAHSWQCLSCPVREHTFCGALLGSSLHDAVVTTQPDWQQFRTVSANESIVKRGDASRYVHVLCNGWAVRLFRLFDGKRQILNVLLEGDLFSAVTIFVDRLPFTVDAVTDVQVGRFDRDEVLARLRTNPSILTRLSETWVSEQAVADELLTALAKRSAEERIAYLFLHLAKRLASRNIIHDDRYPFPLRQQHIADIVGLTPVHTSRVIGAFRASGLIDLSKGHFKINDSAELERIGSLR